MIPIVICSSNVYSAVVPVAIDAIEKTFGKSDLFEFHVIGLTRNLNIDKRAKYYLYPGSDTDDWSTRVRFGVLALPCEYFILITEDILFTRGEVSRLIQLYDSMILSKKEYLRLSPFPGPDDSGKDVGFVSSECLHRISMQPSVWRKEYLLNLLKGGESIWEFELYGSFRTSCNDQIYAVGNAQIEYIEVITRGQLTPAGYSYMEELGFEPIDLPIQNNIAYGRRLMKHKLQSVLMKLPFLRFFTGW